MTGGQGKQDGAATGTERFLVSILAFGAAAALFALRSFDDNRLTSWQWAFAGASPGPFYAIVLAAIALANLVARAPLPGRRPAAVLFVSSYAVAALFWGEPEVIVDASRYFTQAKHLEVYGVRYFLTEWGKGISAWTDLPLVPFLYGLVLELFGESRRHVQAFTTLLFAGTAVATYGLGKALWDEDMGLTAGTLLLAIPYLITQVPCMLVDVPTTFFLTLAAFTVVRALQNGGVGWILLASLAVFLAFFSKYSTWLLLSVLPVAWIVLRSRGAPGALRTGSAIALLSGALVVAAVLSRHEVFSQQIALLRSYQAPGLGRWGESFASTFLFQVHPFLTAAALVSAWLAIRRRDARWVIVAWPVLLLLVLRVHRIRYTVPAFPMLALMGAYGLHAIGTREVRRLATACAVLSSLAVALHGYLPFLRSVSSVNLARAGEYLDSIGEERVEVFTVYREETEVNPAVAVPILDLFTRKKLSYSYEGAPQSALERAKSSALRFTWEYRNPGYYAPGSSGADEAIAVISDGAGQPLPERVEKKLAGHRLARSFTAYEGIFPYRTMVEVYRPVATSR